MKLKKAIALVMVGMMTMTVLAGCGSSKTAQEAPADAAAEASTETPSGDTVISVAAIETAYGSEM